MTELESDYISDIDFICITNVDNTSSFRGIIKKRSFKILKIRSKY